MLPYRYAIYFVPDGTSPLYAAGSRLLGYDIRKEIQTDWPALQLPHALSHAELAAAARHYGLHATIVAPFLPSVPDEEPLIQILEELCQRCPKIIMPLTIQAHRGFLALMPDLQSPAGQAAHRATRQMADLAVRQSEPLRRPLSSCEYAARAENLSQGQREYLARWGYPYVFEHYYFHITLCGPFAHYQGLQESLSAYLESAMEEPLKIDSLCLCRQSSAQRNSAGKYTGDFSIVACSKLQQ
jgi:hypothetical protein